MKKDLIFWLGTIAYGVSRFFTPELGNNLLIRVIDILMLILAVSLLIYRSVRRD